MEIQNLIPWRRKGNGEPFRSLHKAVDRLFEDFETGWPEAPALWPGNGGGAYLPRLDVSESEKSVAVDVELPGMDEKDIDVSLANGFLTVSGEKKEEKEEKGKNYYRAERRYGSFRRSIALPCEVAEEKIEARFNKGVLHITLPKSTQAQHVKKIAVKVS